MNIHWLFCKNWVFFLNYILLLKLGRFLIYGRQSPNKNDNTKERKDKVEIFIYVYRWVLRLIYYPFWILCSTSYQIIMTENKEKHQVEGPIYYYMFNTLLFRLLVLYIFWWVLIYRMLVKQVQDRSKLSEDVRSDSESDDDHED
ncbi:hypothetical protein HID58_076639 [Brassica napus]|uniref:TLC domain-containing protein n=3 Tax=Brassica TaxID=3705 RepID=A0ABQ7YNC4_BRANA|nr:hypothetical protein HID58_076639 [Brassica napus]VDD38406.1 unnamed protein product [Brassica oleracea]